MLLGVGPARRHRVGFYGCSCSPLGAITSPYSSIYLDHSGFGCRCSLYSPRLYWLLFLGSGPLICATQHRISLAIGSCLVNGVSLPLIRLIYFIDDLAIRMASEATTHLLGSNRLMVLSDVGQPYSCGYDGYCNPPLRDVGRPSWNG